MRLWNARRLRGTPAFDDGLLSFVPDRLLVGRLGPSRIRTDLAIRVHSGTAEADAARRAWLYHHLQELCR